MAARSRSRRETESGGRRAEAEAISAPMERRRRWAPGSQSGGEEGRSEAARRPRAALVSSMAPRASKRTGDLGRAGRPGREEKPESPGEGERDGGMGVIGGKIAQAGGGGKSGERRRREDGASPFC